MQELHLDAKDADDEEDDDESEGVETYYSKTQLGLDSAMVQEIYGSYNLFTWLRYWYLDGVTKQKVMLADKTRVIYHKVKKDKNGKPIKRDKSKKKKEGREVSDDELRQMNIEAGKLAKFKLKALGLNTLGAIEVKDEGQPQ